MGRVIEQMLFASTCRKRKRRIFEMKSPLRKTTKLSACVIRSKMNSTVKAKHYSSVAFQ